MAGASPSPRKKIANGMKAMGGIGRNNSMVRPKTLRVAGQVQKAQQVAKAAIEPMTNPVRTRKMLAKQCRRAEPSAAIVASAAMADCGEGISGARTWVTDAVSHASSNKLTPEKPRSSEVTPR